MMTAAPTETTHLLNAAPRTKSQTCNQLKVLPICTNSLQFSFIPREASIFLSFAALRTNGFCFLKVSFFSFKHILRNIRTPKDYTFNLCVICITGGFQTYTFLEPQGKTFPSHHKSLKTLGASLIFILNSCP